MFLANMIIVEESFMKSIYSISMIPAILLFIAYVYLGATDAGAHSKDDPNRWLAPHEMAQRVNPVNKSSESIQRGKDLYLKHCTLCHGPNARGDGPAAKGLRQKPTDLAAMAGMHEDGDVAWKIAEGRGVMPGWKERLTEEQIWDLVNFTQSLKGTVEEQSKDMKKH
jgi:mono/diheme cytochrome c family protein